MNNFVPAGEIEPQTPLLVARTATTITDRRHHVSATGLQLCEYCPTSTARRGWTNDSPVGGRLLGRMSHKHTGLTGSST